MNSRPLILFLKRLKLNLENQLSTAVICKTPRYSESLSTKGYGINNVNRNATQIEVRTTL